MTVRKTPKQYEMREEIIGSCEWGDGKKYPIFIQKPKALVTEIQHPKSLGELCIELSQDAFRAWKMGTKGPRGSVLHMNWAPGQDRGMTSEEWETNIREKAKCYTTTGDIRALRVAMYHRKEKA